MTATPPDDVAAMFDLSPEPDVPGADAADAAAAAEAEEAALAAELAATIASGNVAADAPESRTDPRFKVSWPARLRLPDGHVIDLTVRDISEAGVGLTSAEHIPACTDVGFEVAVPPLDQGGQATPVQGTIKTTYAVAHGSEIRCGATWLQMPPAGLEPMARWIERLRG